MGIYIGPGCIMCTAWIEPRIRCTSQDVHLLLFVSAWPITLKQPPRIAAWRVHTSLGECVGILKEGQEPRLLCWVVGSANLGYWYPSTTCGDVSLVTHVIGNQANGLVLVYTRFSSLGAAASVVMVVLK